MGRKQNTTDKVFRDSLKNFQQSPPDDVWTGIDGALQTDRRKGRLAWMGRIAAAAAIVIAAGTTWILVQQDTDSSTSQVDPLQEQVDQPSPSEELQTQEQQTQELAARDEPPASEPTEESALAIQPAEISTYTASAVFESESPAEEPEIERNLSPERLGGKPASSLLVSEPAGADVLAMNTKAGEEPLRKDEYSGEGIDVFEEFGEEEAPAYDRWAVGGQATPLYSYRNIESTESAYYSTNQLDNMESGIMSYAGGVNVNYSPARRLSLQSGLYYSRMGMTVEDTYIASVDGQAYRVDFPAVTLAMTNSSGDIMLGAEKANTILSNIRPGREEFSDAHSWSSSTEDPEIRQGDILQHFEYIEVPMILRYRLVDRKLGLNLLGGLSTNFLVGSNVYFQESGSKDYIGTTGNLKPVNYSSVLGVGLQYSLNRKLNILMEPTFRYYLNSVNLGSGVDSHPYSIGFFTGISYSF